MASPFGNHPTVAEYLHWAIDTIGCTVNTGFSMIEGQSSRTVIRIVSPTGQRVILMDLEQSDRLLPTDIDYIDRRLGVDSPWDSWPA